MNKDPRALSTMIRNRLTSSIALEEKSYWFHEKGIDLKKENGFFFLKTNNRGHYSELSDLCQNGLIYKSNNLLAYFGSPIKSYTLEEAKSIDFIWDTESTYFVEKLTGTAIYMFWDSELKSWNYASDKKSKSPYSDLAKSYLRLEQSGEPFYTYKLMLIEKGDNSGLYVDSVFVNKTFKEAPWDKVREFAIRFNIKNPAVYKFEGFENLENSDFPLYAIDSRVNKILIEKIK